jgi:UDP-N-acetylmuramyl pentapeptide phosphotransferase/UDP-N-acetylglucosamine-1-phosphate transferase
VENTLVLTKTLLLSSALVLFSMPTLILVAKLKRLVDEPEGDRKLHTRAVPTIGGVAVFFGFLASVTLFLPTVILNSEAGEHWGAALTALIALFFVGLKDDLVGLSPSKKLLVHLLLGGLLIFEGGFRITTFNGLFGIHEIPFYASSAFSLFVYIVVVNAMNLIDGVDGLAGGFGVISSLAFGALFAATGQTPSAVVAFALAGALAGFLRHNWHPAKIFLGDGGSLQVGLLAYVFAVQCINLDEALLPDVLASVPSPVIAMTVLSYPLVDTLRVFTLRVLKGRSPFAPDRNHLHHRMMALGWGHRRTSSTVYAYTLLMAGLAWGIFTFISGNETVLFVGLLVLAFALFAPILRKSASIKANRRERIERERHQLRRDSGKPASLTEI